jgi:hypothetical protein
LTTLLAVPAAGVPVAAVLGRIERDHDFVALTGTDLVVAARAAVRLLGLVRLHVPDIDPRLVMVCVFGPAVLETHATTVITHPGPGRIAWIRCSSSARTEW